MIVYRHNYNILSDCNIITIAEIVSIDYDEQINSVASKRIDDYNLLLWREHEYAKKKHESQDGLVEGESERYKNQI